MKKEPGISLSDSVELQTGLGCHSLGYVKNDQFVLRSKIFPYFNQSTCSPSEVSDQSAHSHSLIRIFTWCILDSQGCKRGQRRLWLDCADAQIDLSLSWVHVSEGTFSNVAAHSVKPW